VDHGQIPQLLAQGDLYVSCSRSDGTSACLLEAMATGLFPVVSDIESNRDWIRNKDQGALVPLDAPQLLADAITEALDSVDKRRQAAAANRALIEERASWGANMGRIEALYARLAGSV
jgi:glycosyltransferase involved in cell wall biosynthesis